ncbi:MAG TPA: hypothetical protein DGH68_06905 [Bacteroidetes bacterium]|nr:hypothetical protein [Bacteroidota bacterium]
MAKGTRNKSMWGIGLLVAYGAFIAGILALVYLSMSQQIDLVSEKYYDQGIHYQDRITALENSRNLREKLSVSVQPTELILQFPKEFVPADIAGRITLYRADDKHKDASFDISLDTTARQRIPTSSLLHGLWQVKVNWKANGLEYYTEQAAVLP